MSCQEYFGNIGGQCFSSNWDFGVYSTKYGNTEALADHPQLQSNCWLWKRHITVGRYNDHDTFVALKMSNVSKNMPLISYAQIVPFPCVIAACTCPRFEKRKP